MLNHSVQILIQTKIIQDSTFLQRCSHMVRQIIDKVAYNTTVHFILIVQPAGKFDLTADDKTFYWIVQIKTQNLEFRTCTGLRRSRSSDVCPATSGKATPMFVGSLHSWSLYRKTVCATTEPESGQQQTIKSRLHILHFISSSSLRHSVIKWWCGEKKIRDYFSQWAHIIF